MFTQEDILGLIKTNQMIYEMGIREGERRVLEKAEELTGVQDEN